MCTSFNLNWSDTQKHFRGYLYRSGGIGCTSFICITIFLKGPTFKLWGYWERSFGRMLTSWILKVCIPFNPRNRSEMFSEISQCECELKIIHAVRSIFCLLDKEHSLVPLIKFKEIEFSCALCHNF